MTALEWTQYFSHYNMFLKGYPLGAKNASKTRNQSVHTFWARLACFCHLGFISDPLIVSKFHNETHEECLWGFFQTLKGSKLISPCSDPAEFRTHPRCYHCSFYLQK